MNIENFLSFSKLLADFSRIERTILIPGADKYENDVEHSYHLAMMAWYVIESQKLDLDLSRVLKYSLVHDLVEIYAGDTDAYANAEHLAEKKEREEAAAKKLRDTFPELENLHELIAAYEKREDRESRLVYALDKILPILRNREEGGRMWREKGITLDSLIANKAPRVAVSPEIQPYFDELVELLRQERLTAD